MNYDDHARDVEYRSLTEALTTALYKLSVIGCIILKHVPIVDIID